MCLKEGCYGSSYLPRRPFELAFFWSAGKLLAVSIQLSEKRRLGQSQMNPLLLADG
jgi:hypothetical protein